MATNSAAIDQFDKSMKKQIASILRALVYVKSVKEDNTPCKIDEVVFVYDSDDSVHSVSLIFWIIIYI